MYCICLYILHITKVKSMNIKHSHLCIQMINCQDNLLCTCPMCHYPTLHPPLKTNVPLTTPTLVSCWKRPAHRHHSYHLCLRRIATQPPKPHFPSHPVRNLQLKPHPFLPGTAYVYYWTPHIDPRPTDNHLLRKHLWQPWLRLLARPRLLVT